MTAVDDEFMAHINDLKRALGENVSEEKIEVELKKYFEYGVNATEAKKAVVKKLGGDLNALFKSTPRTLAEVQPSDKSIDIKVKVISINPKTVSVQGTDKDIFYGLLADSTTIRPFTAWNDFKLGKDDVKDWRGEPQINLGNTTTVEPTSDPDLETLEPSSLPAMLPGTEYQIGSLRDGLSNITTIGRLLSVEPRTVTVMGEDKEIFTGILADNTGKIAYTAWSDFQLKPDEVIKIKSAYIRSWRGVPKLNFDDRMEVTRLPTDTLPNIDKLSLEKVTQIDQLLELGGGIDVTVEGTILDIKEGSGLITRCTECNRVLRDGACMVHGTQSGQSDLRVKAVVDDGSGALMIVLNAELTSKILGETLEECESEIKESGVEKINTILEDLENSLLFQPIRFKGTVTTDDYGAMMICSEFDQLVLSEEVQIRAKDLINNINSDIWQTGVL